MDKKLYYTISDNNNEADVTMELSGCMAWIEGDMQSKSEKDCKDEETECTITPVWMTEEEFNNLPEGDI